MVADYFIGLLVGLIIGVILVAMPDSSVSVLEDETTKAKVVRYKKELYTLVPLERGEK